MKRPPKTSRIAEVKFIYRIVRQLEKLLDIEHTCRTSDVCAPCTGHHWLTELELKALDAARVIQKPDWIRKPKASSKTPEDVKAQT